MPDEKALVGWKAIAAFFGWSESKMRSYADDLVIDGTLFYSYMGRPPQKRACAFPTHLREWQKKKSLENKII